MTNGSVHVRASAREGMPFSDPEREKARDRDVAEDVEHLHGPGEVAGGPDKLVVTCPVYNDEPWIKGFIEHHFSLGAAHIALMDNGSEDATTEIAKGYKNVTILKTGVAFKTHQLAMERHLIRRFGSGSWVLCLDQDELFDYPYSDVVSLKSLLAYLNRNRYTAVVSHMLDMFSDKPLSRVAEDEKGMRGAHRFYDLSDIRAYDYREHVGDGNEISSEEIDVLRGGIQTALSNAETILTKHPLMFIDTNIGFKADSAHWVDDARVADITGVVLHYKFTSDFQERVVRAVEEVSYDGGFQRYKGYFQAFEENSGLSVRRETSKELASVNDLVADGFLKVSEKYMEWVDERESEKASPGVVRTRPSRLGGAFCEAEARSGSRASFGAGRDEVRYPVLSKVLHAERGRGEGLEGEARCLRPRSEALRRSRGLKFLGAFDRMRRRLIRKLPLGRQ